jgi:uncharacterized protein YndB with AHSA1/START domain
METAEKKTLTKKEFKVNINAPRNIVWHALWNDAHYRNWTSAFHEGSYAESDWNEGSEIKFLGPEGGGMYSEIAKKDEPSFMSFRHLGELKNFEKQPASTWAGGMENYRLEEKDGGTELTVEVDLEPGFVEQFTAIFPKALQRVKEIAESEEGKSVTVEATINAPVEKVWNFWSAPEHITQWCQASDDWHAPKAENDLRTGGSFSTTMAAKDGSFSFDFGGTYTNVRQHELMEYVMGDGRKVRITFAPEGKGTRVVETFNAEAMHPVDFQRSGWQAIIDNFRKYTESK